VESGLYRTSDARTRREIIVLGVDPADHPFRIPAMVDQAHRLAGRDAAIMDSSTVRGYGPVVPGLRTEVEHRSIEIIATYAHGTGFIAPASMFVSDATLARLFPGSRIRLAGLGLLRLTPGADPKAVARRLRAALPDDVQVMTRGELERSEQRYFVRGRPLGIMFSGGVLLAFTVGAVILYQILASEVLRQYREYATLKAIGYGTAYLNGVVLKQAALFAVFGFLPGTGAAWALYEITRIRTHLPMIMTPLRIATVLGLSLAMCALAGLLASRKAAKADPADLF
jgi:putative ABC transport system permease protein